VERGSQQRPRRPQPPSLPKSASPSASFFGESWRAWVALLVGVLAVSAHSASSITVSVLMKSILAEFRWERTEFAGAMTLRMLVMVAVIPFAGQLTDRLGARSVLVAGACIVGLGNLTISAITSLTQLYPAMAIVGPGQACIGSVAASALVLRLFRARKGVAIGILNGGDNLINSAVPPLAAVLLAAVGWRSTMVALASCYLLLGGLIYFALRAREGGTNVGSEGDQGTPARLRPAGFRELPWRDGRLWMLILSYACIYAFITSVQLHFHAFQTDIGRTSAEASRLLSMFILVGAVGAPLFGWVAERSSARAALLIVVAGLTATSVVLWVVPGFYGFALWAVAYGLFNSGVVTLLTLVLDELFGIHRIGRLMGVSMVFCMLATMIGNLFSAAIFDHFGSYVLAWQSYTVLMAVTLVPVARLWRMRSA
jgi:MFS family permease